MSLNQHLIENSDSVRNALIKLNELGIDAVLFVVDAKRKLLGSLTDGDLRRGFINGLSFQDPLTDFVHASPGFVYKDELARTDIESFRRQQLRVLPVLNRRGRVVDVINLRQTCSVVPADVVLMAGGRGQRLMPLTEHCPKPLLKVGSKPIIEHNIDRLLRYGMNDIHISINYLGNMLEEYFGSGSRKQASISYVKEHKPMGTIGALRQVDGFKQEDILVMNSDLLTNIDFADFYASFKQSGADMAVATIGYSVDVPYAVLELDEQQHVKALAEKPRYVYYSNAGIYLIKRSLLQFIPEGESYDVPDLMSTLISQGYKIHSYPILGYWLDIGRMQDFEKAQQDIAHIQL